MAYVVPQLVGYAVSGTPGTGTITLASVLTAHLSMAGAGVSDGDEIRYIIADGDEREVGRGVYTASGTTLTRVVEKSTNSDSAVSLTSSAQVFCHPSAKDYPVGQQTIFCPAASMIGTTTNGAVIASTELATNDVMVSSMDFDTATEEHVQFGVLMPKSWDLGTIICQPVWSHAATTTNFGVVWGFQAVAFADGDAMDAAFGTEVTSTDTGGTTDDCYIGPETSAMTVAGSPAAEEYVIFQVSRVVANGSDTMAIDARLMGVKIHYTVDEGSDD